MKNVFLCTGADKNYFSKRIFNDCLESYSNNTKKVQKYVFLVDNVDADVNTYGITKKYIPWEDIKAKNSNRCIQHGEFVNFFPECDDEDIIIFTDGDIILQREFSDKELEMIRSLPENTFLANFNYKLNSSLEDIKDPATFGRICDFLKSRYDIEPGELKNYKEMNTGVLIGRKKDFKTLSELYAETHQELQSIINHFCYQQYLINVIIGKYFNYIPLDYSFHSHCHHSIRNGDESYSYNTLRNSGVPSRLILDGGNYFYDDKVILFAHKLHKYRYQ